MSGLPKSLRKESKTSRPTCLEPGAQLLVLLVWLAAHAARPSRLPWKIWRRTGLTRADKLSQFYNYVAETNKLGRVDLN